MKFHEAANIFPLDEEHLQELADDIKKHGQQVPIEVIGDLIVDGRRRYKACQLAKVEPQFVEVNPNDPVAYVLSLNLHRRHLKPSQLAMIGARAKDVYAQQAKERMREGGGDKRSSEAKAKSGPLKSTPPVRKDTRDAAGEAVGVSGYSIDRATEVLASGKPEVVEAVDTGKVSVNAASKIAKLPKDEQPQALQEHLQSPRKPPEKKGKPATVMGGYDKNRTVTKAYAISTAKVSITQLDRIPAKNPFRTEALKKVANWIEKELTQ